MDWYNSNYQNQLKFPSARSTIANIELKAQWEFTIIPLKYPLHDFESFPHGIPEEVQYKTINSGDLFGLKSV